MATPPAPMRSERRVMLMPFRLAALRCWRRRRWGRSGLLNHRRRRGWRGRRHRNRDGPPKALAHGQADDPWLADVVADAGAQSAFAVQRELRISIEQVGDICACLPAVVPLEAHR